MNNNSQEIIKKAGELFKTGAFNEVTEILTQVIEKDNASAEAYELRGLCHYALRRVEVGIRDLCKAVDLDEKKYKALYDEGLLVCEHIDFSDFSIEFDIATAKEVYQMSINHLTQLTTLFFEQNKMEEALIHATRLVRFDSNDELSVGIYGKVLLRANQYEEAILACEKLLVLDPESPRANNNLGYALMGVGRYKEAIKYFDITTKLEPEFAYPYSNRGFCKFKEGDKTGAIEDLRYALELDATNAFAYKFLGIVHLEYNEIGLAREAFKKSLELDTIKEHHKELNDYLSQLSES